MKSNLPDATERLAYNIIGAAIAVHKRFGPGLLEKIYERALCIELDARGIRFERQKRINLYHRGRPVGDYFADLVVENRIIVEIKCVTGFEPVHFAQVMTYLKLTNLRLGLLINFYVPALKDGVKRVIM